jgi:hypothetical protein
VEYHGRAIHPERLMGKKKSPDLVGKVMGLGLFFDGRISPSRRTDAIIPHPEKQVKPWSKTKA